MSIEDIIRVWKADEDSWQAPLVASPVGEELTEEELLQVSGGVICTGPLSICTILTCGNTCGFTCGTAPTACFPQTLV
jgi:hypothetical protein